MKERPILFNGEMVRAVQGGSKTQTRRTAGLKAVNRYPGLWSFWREKDGNFIFKPDDGFQTEYIKCPYGVPGDRLWVREAWAIRSTPELRGFTNYVIYHADTEGVEMQFWKSLEEMPRWASRITLEIVSVRVERVQYIKCKDITAEGIDEPCIRPRLRKWITLWNSINEKKGFGWDMNPWVWVVEFKEVKV